MNSILSVSQINTYISLKLKNDVKLRGIAIKGEIADFSQNRSGHIYFSLHDQFASIKAVMFASNAAKLRFLPMDGMAVTAYGNIEIYERDGIYQIVVSQLIPDGVGAAFNALQKLKEKLKALGVFDAPKRPIPRYPEKIAVVTSAGGAAVQDVKSVVSKRYPLVSTEVFPTAVQGLEAPSGIASALLQADSAGADVIILTRGGGSAEDLSAFNTEAVVMAVYNCKTPVISAVGHEIDLTLCDLAADLRAPTPTAAAVLATPDINDMRAEIKAFGDDIRRGAEKKLLSCRELLKRYEFALSAFSVEEKLNSRKRDIQAIKRNIEDLARHRLKVLSAELSGLKSTLFSLDPKSVLSRGYALVYKDGKLAPDISGLNEGDNVKIFMRGGSADAELKRINGDENEV